jgi:pilus assembly protein Flp/PilA
MSAGRLTCPPTGGNSHPADPFCRRDPCGKVAEGRFRRPLDLAALLIVRLATKGSIQVLKAYVSMQTYLAGLMHREDKGATAVEYGLLVGLIALVIIGIVATLGTKLSGIFSNVNNSLNVSGG